MIFLFLVITFSQDQNNSFENHKNLKTFYKNSIESIMITLDTKKQNLSSKNIQSLSTNLNQIISLYGDIYSYSMKPEEEIELSYDGHSVFNGYVQAFEEHRPITISPDIFWLLIVQGFSIHLAINHDHLRSKFVDFTGSKELNAKIAAPSVSSISPNEWMEIFSQFIDQIKNQIKNDIIDTLTPNFTTTTKVSLAAGQLSIMNAMKYYFNYRTRVCLCGFPYIIVEGTLEDWEKIKHKIENLRNYEIDDWIDSLHPIVDKFIELKRDNIIDKEFWNSMIHVHDGHDVYDLKCFDGWFSNLFPFDNNGYRLYGKVLAATKLPSEILTVPFILELTNDLNIKGIDYNFEFLTGFVGITQDNETASIKPKIGWIIRRQNYRTKPFNHLEL